MYTSLSSLWNAKKWLESGLIYHCGFEDKTYNQCQLCRNGKECFRLFFNLPHDRTEPSTLSNDTKTTEDNLSRTSSYHIKSNISWSSFHQD